MFGLQHWDLILIAVLVLIIFGPKNLPRIGQSLGRGIREFKDATQGLGRGEDEDEPQTPPRIDAANAPGADSQSGDRPPS